MGFVGSDAEDELRATRPSTTLSTRFLFSKKFSDDGVAVVYGSVPRKLRSANKKRCREMVSPHFLSSKKPNYARNESEFLRKVGLNQSNPKRQCVLDGFGEETVIGSITKDEEEVVETLYALAAMFPETGKTDIVKADVEPMETKSSGFLDKEDSRPAGEDAADMNEELGTKEINTYNAEAANRSSNVAGSAEVLISHAEHEAKMLTCDTIVSCVLPGSKNRPDLRLSSGKTESVSESAAHTRGQSESSYSVRENKNDGSSSMDARDSDKWRSLEFNCILQSSALGKPITTKMGDHVRADSKNSRKRCCTQVYISQLIKNLQITERVKTLQVPLKQGANITHNNSNKCSGGLNGMFTTYSAVCSSAERNSAEVRNAILLHKRLLHDQQQASTSSRLYTVQKQNVDFSSLSVKADGGPRIPPQLDVPHTQSKKHNIVPFLLPQDYYSSNAFLSHTGAAAAQQVQFPSYLLGSAGSGTLTTVVTASAKKLPWLQQQHIWDDQLTALCNPGPGAAPSVPNWQNGGQDSPSLLQFAAASIILPPRSSAEVLGTGNAVALQHQQQVVAVCPPLQQHPSRGPGLHHRAPYSYEGKGGGRPAESVRPLQFLCNERL